MIKHNDILTKLFDFDKAVNADLDEDGQDSYNFDAAEFKKLYNKHEIESAIQIHDGIVESKKEEEILTSLKCSISSC